MARPLRIEFPHAIYHVMARGNGRQAIFHIDGDYQRMTDGLANKILGVRSCLLFTEGSLFGSLAEW